MKIEREVTVVTSSVLHFFPVDPAVPTHPSLIGRRIRILITLGDSNKRIRLKGIS